MDATARSPRAAATWIHASRRERCAPGVQHPALAPRNALRAALPLCEFGVSCPAAHFGTPAAKRPGRHLNPRSAQGDAPMKQGSKVLAALILSAVAATASATPSTTFWTPATTYTQPYLVPHLTYDTYVAERGAMANDYGLTIGVLPFEKLQAEVGVDLFQPGLVKDGLYLNAKLTLPEGAFGAYQPGVSLGIQSVGFTKDVSDYNHLHLSVSKAFAGIGTFVVGGYYGLNKNLYTLAGESASQAGVMAAYTSPDININLPGLQKVAIIADYASGKNGFAGGGVGAAIYFSPAVQLLTGPVFLADGAYATNFMWSVQLDVDVELLKK
jgi:hypothetical protein